MSKDMRYGVMNRDIPLSRAGAFKDAEIILRSFVEIRNMVKSIELKGQGIIDAIGRLITAK